jgi:hypothetical protein
MKRVECDQLLTYISTLDNREVSDVTVEAWMGVVGDLRQADCMEAVRRHFATSGEYLKPYHVRSGANTVANERAQAAQLELERHLTPTPIPDALFGEQRERGRALLAYVQAALKVAGQDAVNGQWLGMQRAGEIAENATRQWLKAHRAGEDVPPKRGYTCGRSMCRCTHGPDPVTGAVCEGGWINDDRPNPDPASNGSVVRCPVCAPERAKILADAPTLAAAGRALRLSNDR